MRWLLITWLAAGAAIEAAGQQASAFEVASIRPNLSGAISRSAEFLTGGQRFVATNISLGRLVVLAYGTTPRQLGELAPIMYQRYDVQASAGRPAKRAEMLQMLQTLLVERFKLKVRRELRETPVYALVVAKHGPKLTASTEQIDWDLARADGNERHRGRVNNIGFRNESMGDFAVLLSSLVAVGRIVMDKTDLDGQYDFELNFTPSDLPGPPTDSDAPSIFTAPEEQLGLRLESRRASVEFLSIEHVENPLEN